jgi:TrpR-related protein YerC/YecD
MNKSSGKKTSGPRNTVSHEADFEALYDAFLQLKTRDEYKRFMQDLCTPAELLAFAERWRVAKMLNANELSYRDIHAKTGVSITTVGRVARFLMQEPHQGYQLVLQRLKARK